MPVKQPAGATLRLQCIDPRFESGMSERNLFEIAGGPIGLVDPAFAVWHDAAWRQLAEACDRQAVRRVEAFTHRDCGAASIAYGERVKADRAFETRTHATALRTVRDELAQRHPWLDVGLGILDLDGTVDIVD